MNAIGKETRSDLPPGYEFVRLGSQSLIALPNAVALAKRTEDERRASVQEFIKRQDQRKINAKVTTPAEAESTTAKRKGEVDRLLNDYGDDAPPGQYRVLAKWTEFLDTNNGPDQALRNADKDVNERGKKLRDRLIHKGPDRRIARPEDWRDAMDRLEASLPHFREPIRLIRNTLALSAATRRPVRVPPILLLGPPGIGKTYFSHRVAELMEAPHASIAFDQPTAGSTLRGSDSYWANSSTGLLFNILCLGDCANPVVLLDELDKSGSATGSREIDPLAQLHGVLEPETSRSTVDISVDMEFDASLVTYIATANSLRGLTMPILSRFEVFSIEPPETSDAVEIARAVVDQVLKRLNLQDTIGFDRKGLYVLAHLSPRLMLRTTEKAIAAAISAGQTQVGESNLWAELGSDSDEPRLH